MSVVSCRVEETFVPTPLSTEVNAQSIWHTTHYEARYNRYCVCPQHVERRHATRWDEEELAEGEVFRMAWQGMEIKLEVRCAEGKWHVLRLRLTGWGKYTVVYNPCVELLGEVFARMAPCTHNLRKDFPKYFSQNRALMLKLITALREAGTDGVPDLIQALGDSDSEVRRAASDALGEIGDSRAVQHLIQLFTDKDNGIRLSVCKALGRIRDARAVPVLIQALGDGDSSVRRAAAEALVKIGTPAVPALIQALGDRNGNVRRAAVEALGKLGDPQAVPRLIQALEDSDRDVRLAAVEALGKLGDPQAVPALTEVLRDNDNPWWVRQAVSEAIKKIEIAKPAKTNRSRQNERRRNNDDTTRVAD